jgi:hypothetical protein
MLSPSDQTPQSDSATARCRSAAAEINARSNH